MLLETVQDNQRDREVGPQVAWFQGSFIAHACSLLSVLALEPREQVLSALCRAAETVSRWASQHVWQTLLEIVFPDRQSTRIEPDATRRSGVRVIYRDPTELTVHQRRAVESIARNPYWDSQPTGFGPLEETLWAFGLPTTNEQLQRLLANEPIGPPDISLPLSAESTLDLAAICEQGRTYLRDQAAQDPLRPLQGEVWYTGFDREERQMLVVFDHQQATVCWFDGDGRRLETESVAHQLGKYPGPYWQRDKFPELQTFLSERFGYVPGTIHIRSFEDREAQVMTKAGPWWFDRFLENPEWTFKENRQREARRVLEWIEKRDTWVLHVAGCDFSIATHDGRCTGT